MNYGFIWDKILSIPDYSKADSEEMHKLMNIVRAEFLLINEEEPDKLLDAIYTWYIKNFGDIGL